MKKSQQAALIRTIVISAIFVLAVAGYYLYSARVKWDLYQDEENSVKLEKPSGWVVASTDDHVRIAESATDDKAPSVLIKMDYPEAAFVDLGLDVGEQVTIGGKTMRRADHEFETVAREGVPASKQTFTFLLWEAPDGRKVIFEITPWQKPEMHESVEKIIASFNPL